MPKVIHRWLDTCVLARVISIAVALFMPLLLPSPAQAQVGPDLKVCFYEHAEFQGERFCVGPGKLHDVLPPWIDRKISSVRVPRGLKALLFTERLGDGRGLGTDRDLDYPVLARIGMNDLTRSLQVSRLQPDCTKNCMILLGNAYDLQTQFEKYWTQSKAGHVSLAFELRRDRPFTVQTFGMNVRFDGSSATIETMPSLPRSVTRLSTIQVAPSAAYGVVAFATDGRNFISTQVFLTDKNRRYLNATPIITRSLQMGANSTLAIHNTVVPGRSLGTLSLTAVSFAVEDQPASRRVRRGTHCWNNPILAVINFFSGNCSTPSADSFYADDRDKPENNLTLIAGEKANESAAFPAVHENTGTTALLDEIIGIGQNPMAIHAAARVCNKSLAAVIRSRERRGVDDHLDCGFQTAAIITLYQAAFSEYWNQQDFWNIIDNIRRTGHAGYPTNDERSAQRLASAVMARVTELDQIRQSFHEANVLYQYSTYGSMDFENITAQYAAARAAMPPGPGPSTRFANVTQAASAALGRYTLDMRDYRPPASRPPRLWSNGQWVETQDAFSAEILVSTDTQRLGEISTALAQWETDYRAAAAAASTGGDSSYARLLQMGVSLSRSLQQRMAIGPRPNIVVVAVSFRGQVVAVLRGYFFGDGTSADIGSAVSMPSNVQLPYREGALRGAGGFALAAFLEYARQRGVRIVNTNVATAPSAEIARVGFRFSDEL